MRVLRNILLFIASFVVADVVIGLAIDAAILAWSGDLSATTEQAVLAVKYLAYLTAAILMTWRLDAALRKRSDSQSTRTAHPPGEGDVENQRSSAQSSPRCSISSPDAMTAGDSQALHSHAPSAPTDSMSIDQIGSEANPASGRRSKSAIAAIVVGLLALGAGLGAMAMALHEGGSGASDEDVQAVASPLSDSPNTATYDNGLWGISFDYPSPRYRVTDAPKKVAAYASDHDFTVLMTPSGRKAASKSAGLVVWVDLIDEYADGDTVSYESMVRAVQIEAAATVFTAEKDYGAAVEDSTPVEVNGRTWLRQEMDIELEGVKRTWVFYFAGTHTSVVTLFWTFPRSGYNRSMRSDETRLLQSLSLPY